MSKSQNQPMPFSWGDIQLDQVVQINGIPYATKQAVGEWLEYAEPRRSINNLLERNRYIEEYAVDIKLMSTDGKKYDSLVFHPIGFLLICMESQTEKAREMKEAIAAFVWHFCQPADLDFKEELELIKLHKGLLVDISKSSNAFVTKGLMGDLIRVSAMLKEPLPDMALLGSKGEQLCLEGV